MAQDPAKLGTHGGATMRGVVIRQHGGFDELRVEDLPVPAPGPQEVRVAVRAVGLNHLDTWVRRGVPGHRFPLPLIPGSDAAGVVDALGPGTHNVAVGQPVVVLPGVSCGACASCLCGEDQLCPDYGILGESRHGTCAELVVVPAQNVAPKPEALSYPEAACVSLVFLTAWSMLLRRAELRPGETVLVHAGASGVGSAAVQIACLCGARVIATAGSAEKRRLAQDLGAERTVDYRTADFADEVRDWTGGRGVDVVFEHVGQATFAESLKCLARAGRLVTCGATTGGAVEVNLHRVFFKSLSILGSTTGSKGDLWRIWRLVEAGRLRPVLGRTLPLAEVGEAHRLLEQREVCGKIVLEV